MREKLKTLSLIQLREIAKSNGIKSVTTYRKPELIEKLVALSETKESASENNSNDFCTEEPVQEPSVEETADKPMIKEDEQIPAREPAFRPVYQRKNYPADGTRPQRRMAAGTAIPRPHASGLSRTQPVRDNSIASPTSGGYVRNGGYTQSYNPVPELTSSPRTPRAYRQTPDFSSHPESAAHCDGGAEISAHTDSSSPYAQELASKEPAHGILELNPDGFGFLRSENYLTGDNDVYVSPAQIRKFNMKTGDVIDGVRRIKSGTEKFAALLYVNSINGFPPAEAQHRPAFEDLTPVFPDSRLHLETENGPLSLRILDLLSPIGKGQRGMIVAPPKAGKTTLLKDIAKAITANYPDMRLIVLLIDERPEEVTDIKECIEGTNVEVIYSTFDEQPDHHKQVAEMVLERAKRLVEHKQDVMILLDSITRLARAYNLTVTPSGRTLSGGLDPSALYMPKKFFGAARNMREGGSLTILATALVETGSRMDDVVFEEFKGTGNMEVVLDRRLSERRIFPAIDICKSGTRREDLLLSPQELEAVTFIRKNISCARPEDSVERILDFFARTGNNQEFVENLAKTKL